MYDILPHTTTVCIPGVFDVALVPIFCSESKVELLTDRLTHCRINFGIITRIENIENSTKLQLHTVYNIIRISNFKQTECYYSASWCQR